MKAKQHLSKVLEKGNKCKFDAEKKLDKLKEKITKKMKGAALIRGSHLLSRVHTASIFSRIGSIQANEQAPPVAFEIDVSSPSSGDS